MVLIDYWDQNSDLFQQFDIDVFSVGNPLDGKKILKS